MFPLGSALGERGDVVATQLLLEVYVSDDCPFCREAERIVAELAPEFPGATIRFVDMGQEILPEEIFAVPTYVINGRVAFLGNPTLGELRSRLGRDVTTPAKTAASR